MKNLVVTAFTVSFILLVILVSFIWLGDADLMRLMAAMTSFAVVVVWMTVFLHYVFFEFKRSSDSPSAKTGG